MPSRSVSSASERLLGLERLDASFEQARAARPGVSLTRDQWREALDEHVDSVERLEQLELGDLYLARACLAGDALAIRAFDTALKTEVTRAARRAGALDAAELFAALRARLLIDPGTLRTYSARGTLGAWLGAAVVRQAHNQRRGEARAQAREALGNEPPEAHDPVVDLLRARFKVDFEEAFRGALAALSARDRALLRLHFVEGMGLDRLARHKQVGRSTAARWIADIRQQLLQHTRAALAARGLGEQTLDSLLPDLAPRLDLSIRRELERVTEP